MKLFYNAKCFDSAVVVDDWPWGFKFKTEARFWVETTKHGDRFVQQTKNPKTGLWCKPKKRTYDAVEVIAMTDQGQITSVGIGNHADQDRIAAVLSDTIDFDKLSDAQKKQICKLNAWADVMSKVTWTIRKADDGKTNEQHQAEQDKIANQLARLANAKATQCMAKNGLI